MLSIRLQNETRLQPQAGAASSNVGWIACATCYALALIVSLDGSSLWTDEAFSAWLASHASFQSFLGSLLSGDSADIQMGLYYAWLFFWAKLFGTGELALRTANIPFILIFSFALVWTSWRIFKSRIAWLAAGLLPFVWHYAAEARPYMAVLALGTATVASLLGFVSAPVGNKQRGAWMFPWICLGCILLGCLFHILFLLVAPPLLAIAVMAAKPVSPWRLWLKPIAAFAIPFLALAAFCLWTFQRDVIAYDYPAPGAKQMVSVLYELAGLSGFGPNRKFSIDFRPYAVWTAIGALTLAAGTICAFLSGIRYRGNNRLTVALAVAAGLSCLEVVALSFLSQKQFDARHLAALVPLFLFLLMALAARPGKLATASLLLLGGAWSTSDIRSAILPEYRKEDFRSAVAALRTIHRDTGAEIALSSDPVAAAYYGLDVQGPPPCYPLGQNCTEALHKVPWVSGDKTVAVDANHWTHDRVVSWLAERRDRVPVAVLVELDRSLHNSAWRPILAQYRGTTRTRVHGFEIVLLPSSHF